MEVPPKAVCQQQVLLPKLKKNVKLLFVCQFADFSLNNFNLNYQYCLSFTSFVLVENFTHEIFFFKYKLQAGETAIEFHHSF